MRLWKIGGFGNHKSLEQVNGFLRGKTKKRPPLPGLPLLLILLLLMLTTACSNPVPNMQWLLHGNRTAASPADLIVNFGFPGQHLILENGNDFVWKDVSVRLNDEYLYRTSILPRGASSIPLSDFQDAEGHPFVPATMTPHRIIVEVQSGFQGKPGYFKW